MGDRKRITGKMNTRKQGTIPSVMRLLFVAVVIGVLLSGLLQVQKTACCAALSIHEPPDKVQLLLETDMRPAADARNTGRDVLFGGILVFVLMLSLLLKIRLQLRPREKREARDASRPVCLALLQRLIKVMRFAGVLQNYDGSESDFPARFAAEVPVISHEEAERFAAVIAKESFGASPPSTQEVDFVHAVCRRAVACLYKKMPWPKKLIFSCRKVF